MIAPGIPSLSERMREDATLINYLLTLKRWLTLSANVVVGRPINLLSVLLSSNRPPFDAPTSESASISASPSGRPNAFQRRSEIGFAQILIGNLFAALFGQLCR